jgi:hypothetical protein
VLNWRIIPAALLAGAIVLPSALFALQTGPAAGDGMEGVLGGRTGSLPWVLVKGTASLIVATLVYPLPFLVFFLIFFGAMAWRGLRTPAPAAGAVAPVPSAALLATVMGIAVGLHWLLVPLARATEFQERLLQPALLILPIYLFMLVERGLADSEPRARAVRNYALMLAAVAGVALFARIGIHAAGADYCRTACRDLLPAADIAAGLRKAGFGGKGTVVLRDIHLGGNLRLHFPEARFMATGYPPKVWPAPAGDGQCLALWTDYKGQEAQHHADIRDYLTGELGVPAEAKKDRVGTVTVHYPGSQRTYKVLYELYDAPQGNCR